MGRSSDVRIPSEWRRPFELAWEAWRAGSFPVGAVVVDGSGTVVAEGRNRIDEPAAPRGQVSATVLAHAELNALTQLPPNGAYDDWTVYTTLEPCLLCTSALRLSRIGAVRYAAADPLWDGVAEIPTLLTERAAAHWTERRGPLSGPLSVWGAVHPAIWYLVERPSAFDGPGELLPEPTVELGRRCVARGVPDADSLDAALELAWPLLDT